MVKRMRTARVVNCQLNSSFHIPIFVIPAKAGILCRIDCWQIPAFAGMTAMVMAGMPDGKNVYPAPILFHASSPAIL